MSSPFAVLRRNQKILLAVFGVIIMVVFVIGSAFDDFFRRHQVEHSDKAIVTWKHGTLGELDLARMRHRSDVVAHFLNEVLKRTQERKGVPKVRPLGHATGEQDLVRRMLLAQKAKDLGIVVSNEAVEQYLSQLSDTKLSGRDYSEIIAAIPNRRIGEPQILEELRQQLAAENVAQMLLGRGYYTLTPSEAWELFNRVHHRVKAEVLPVTVDDYASEVPDPSPTELTKFYDEYKDNYPHPDFPDPGFRQRPRAAFEYLKIEFEKFVTAEKEKLTDEQLREEYEKRIGRGEFKVPELPAAKHKPGDEAMEPDDPAPDKPDASDDKPAEEKPAAEKPAAEKPANKPDEPQAENPAEPACQDAGPAEKPNDQARDNLESKTAEKPGVKPEEKPEEPPTDKPTDKPAEKAGDKPDDKPAGDEAEKPEEKPTDEPKLKVRPFEEVRDDIAKSLARPKAQEAFEKSKAAVRKELDTFAREYRAYVTRKGDSASSGGAPKLDAQEIAQRYGVVAGSTPLVDALSVLDYELGKGSIVSFMGGFRMIRFSEFAFRDGIPLYSIDEVPGEDPDITFLYWKIDEQPARTPPLDEIRTQVVAAWKHRQALPIAKAAAEKMAKEARGKDSLREVFGDKVSETNEFSWMTSGAVAFGMGMPSISRVENVDTAGAGFMESVFALGVGEVGVAVNHPESKVYVVRIASEALTEDVRRTRFMLMGSSTEVRQLAQFESERALVDWFTELQDEMQVKWLPRANAVAMSDE